MSHPTVDRAARSEDPGVAPQETPPGDRDLVIVGVIPGATPAAGEVAPGHRSMNPPVPENRKLPTQ